MSEPTVLFIVPPYRTWEGSLLPLRFPHIGVAYLAAYLKQHGITCHAVDTSLAIRHKDRAVREAIERTQPGLIGLTVYSNLAQECREIIAAVKQATDVPIVAGGPHISVAGEEFLAETGVEYGVEKDGEVPLLNLVRKLAEGSSVAAASIPGVMARDASGAIVRTPNTDIIHDLDEIPFPDWTVFDLEKYTHWNAKTYPLITSRGCPYQCTYCAAPHVTGRRFRMRSAENVVDEMEHYYGQGFRRFGVLDDAFNINLDRAKTICRLIVEREMAIVWDMGNGLRANVVDEEFVKLLKASGCNFVGFGLESGNPEMLKRIKKGLTVDQVRHACELARANGIGTAVNFIIGHPGETCETAMDTLRAAETFPASYVNIFGLMPLKGTEAYDELRRMEQAGDAHFLYDYDDYLTKFSAQGIEPVFETLDLTRAQRKVLLTTGRQITQKSAFRYRFGKPLGTVLYWLTRSHIVFTFFNGLKNTVVGNWIYRHIRHED